MAAVEDNAVVVMVGLSMHKHDDEHISAERNGFAQQRYPWKTMAKAMAMALAMAFPLANSLAGGGDRSWDTEHPSTIAILNLSDRDRA
jgi:hypothetical protein